jgi:6-pyruvoyltetrahydropterin/6-carboxytetrahydropterin synthase
MLMDIGKEFRFEASHQLPNHDGKCARLHGHSWVLKVFVQGSVSEEFGPKEGMVKDFADIKEVVQPIIDMLDHHHLGRGAADLDVPEYWLHAPKHLRELNFPTIPTSENILIWIADQLTPTGLNWSCLVLSETCTSEARLFAVNYAIHNTLKAAAEKRAAEERADDDIPF